MEVIRNRWQEGTCSTSPSLHLRGHCRQGSGSSLHSQLAPGLAPPLSLLWLQAAAGHRSASPTDCMVGVPPSRGPCPPCPSQVPAHSQGSVSTEQTNANIDPTQQRQGVLILPQKSPKFPLPMFEVGETEQAKQAILLILSSMAKIPRSASKPQPSP